MFELQKKLNAVKPESSQHQQFERKAGEFGGTRKMPNMRHDPTARKAWAGRSAL